MTTYTRRAALQISTAAFGTLMLGQAARAASHATEHEVQIRGHAFHPASLTINAGDTVTFVNMDRAPHTATARDRSFDTGRLRRNDQSALRFTTPGSYAYFCAVHPSMTATITVV